MLKSSKNSNVRSPLWRTNISNNSKKSKKLKFNNKVHLDKNFSMALKRAIFSLAVVMISMSVMLIVANQKIEKLNSSIEEYSEKCTQLENENNELVEQNRAISLALSEANKNIVELKKQNETETTQSSINKSDTQKSCKTQTKSSTTTQSNNSTVYKTDEFGKYYEKTMTITAYCSCAKCCGAYAKNRPLDENGKPIVKTASGATAKQKYTLAAGKSYAFGTKMYIPGVGMCEVQDRGGSVSGNHLDMYFESHEAALEWVYPSGHKTLTVRIYI